MKNYEIIKKEIASRIEEMTEEEVIEHLHYFEEIELTKPILLKKHNEFEKEKVDNFTVEEMDIFVDSGEYNRMFDKWLGEEKR